MFGSLKSLFAAIRGLTESIAETKRLFDTANQELRQRLSIDNPENEKEVRALEHQSNGSEERLTKKARK